MPANGGPSLTEFASGLRNPCWVCALPEDVRKEVEDGAVKGVGFKVITRWLTNHRGWTAPKSSYDNQRGQLRRHIDSHMGKVNGN